MNSYIYTYKINWLLFLFQKAMLYLILARKVHMLAKWLPTFQEIYILKPVFHCTTKSSTFPVNKWSTTAGKKESGQRYAKRQPKEFITKNEKIHLIIKVICQLLLNLIHCYIRSNVLENFEKMELCFHTDSFREVSWSTGSTLDEVRES